MKLTLAKRVGLRPSIPKKQIVCISFLIVGVLYTILFAEGCTQNEKTVKANYTFENVNVVPLNEKVILKKRTVAIRNDTIIAIIDPSSETRSEEHTSELQSRGHLVCRLLLEKKNISKRMRGG